MMRSGPVPWLLALGLGASLMGALTLWKTAAIIRRLEVLEVQISTGPGSWRGQVLDELGSIRICLDEARLCPEARARR